MFQFVIRNPDLALVRFKVMDKDVNEDDFIGSFCLPFSSVVPGETNNERKVTKERKSGTGPLLKLQFFF